MPPTWKIHHFFEDMVDAGLLTLSDSGLTIEQVLGSTLLTDVEALTPITKEVLDKVNKIALSELWKLRLQHHRKQTLLLQKQQAHQLSQQVQEVME